MKKFVRVGVLCAAVAALALGNVTGAGAGDGVFGTLVIEPDPVEIGKTVTISNTLDEDSACESDNGPVLVVGWVYPEEDGSIEDIYFEATPDAEGNWSAEVTIPADPAAAGTWVADVSCEYEVQEVTFAPFFYPLTTFQVVAPVTPVEPPAQETAPAEEVRTAPRFTG